MKKSALRKDTFREIKHSFGRFLSILLIIACGVGFFTGVKATAPSMYQTAEEYFTAQSLYDIELLSTVGFSDEDITKVKEIQEIDKVMPAYSFDVLNKKNDKDIVIKVMSLPGENDDAVNVPTLVEGRLPEKDNECVACKGGLLGNIYEVGDTVKVEPQAGSTAVNTVLKQSEYKVVGIVEMPQFISYSFGTSSIGDGMVSEVILVNKDIFLYPRYTEAYITFKCHAQGISAFDDEYEQIFNSVSTQLDDIGLVQYQAFINLSQQQIAEGEAKIAAGRAELDAAAKQLADGESQIKAGEAELADGENQYAAASESTRQQLSDAQRQLEEGRAAYNAGYQAYQEGLAEYESGKQEYEESLQNYNNAVDAVNELQEQYLNDITPYSLSAKTCAWLKNSLGLSDAVISLLQSRVGDASKEQMGAILVIAKAALNSTEEDLAEAKQQLADAEVQLAEGKKELEAGEIKLREGEAAYNAAKALAEAELGAARRELDNGAAQLREAKEEYFYGLAQYNAQVTTAETELTSGQNRIQNAKLELGKYMSGKWYSLGRSEVMVNYSGYKGDADRLDAIANVFPIFFLLVAALVCMTTMTRMIDEQRLQIGTYKALGYKKGEIVSKYLIYAALAGILGCIVGPLVCIEVLPRVIFGAYGTLYSLPYFNIQIPWLTVGISIIVAMLCTVLVAYIACWREMRFQAATLMRPKAPKAGKQILLEKMTFIWNRFNFFQKLTARNLFRYKRRLIMTVIGIAGCMALIVAGFGLDDAISPIVDLQFGEISLYDCMGYLSDDVSSSELSAVMTGMRADKRVDQACLFNQVDVKAIKEDSDTVMDNTYLCVPENPKMIQEFINIRSPETKEALTLKDDGAIITQKMAEKLKVGVGDTFVMKVGEKKYDVKVSDIAENYVYNYIYLTPNYYLSLVKSPCTYNMVYINGTDQLTDHAEFTQDWLKKCDKFVTMYFVSDISGVMTDTIASLRLVVVVMIVCAGMLAFIVLYNLTNINISERIREIATVKVLGFNKKEVNSYVFRENIVMCIFGILVGCVAGYFLAQFIIATVEVSMVTFSKDIHFTSYLFAAALTMIFTVLVNLFMSKVIKKISMVESLKAIE